MSNRQNKWRWTPLDIRILGVIDARAGLAFAPYLLDIPSTALFKACFAGFLFFAALSYWKFTPTVLWRFLRRKIIGPRRQALPWWRRKKRSLFPWRS